MRSTRREQPLPHADQVLAIDEQILGIGREGLITMLARIKLRAA